MRDGFRLFLFLLTACLSGAALAEGIPEDRYYRSSCSVTPQIGASNYPGYKHIMPNNKLALPPGKSLLADGQPVFFNARLFDSDCVPISEAKIELWSANPDGDFRFATKAALATPDPVFAGAGRTTTDNLGQFFFLTVYPGPYDWTITKRDRNDRPYKVVLKRAPHVDIKISHPDFKSFQTSVYFEGDGRNDEDHSLKQIAAGMRPQLMAHVEPRNPNDPNEGIQAVIDIILPGKNSFRGFH